MTDRTAEKSNPAGRHPAPGATTAGKAASPSNAGAPGAVPEDRDRAKPPMTERIQGALSRAAAEHRANADASSGSATGRARPARPARAEQRRSATAARPRSRAPRRARLRLTRVDPWSVMKTSFLLSIAFAVVLVVSVAMVWSVLGAAGVWDSINTTVQSVLGGETASTFDVQDYVGTSRVLGFTMLVAALDVVLLTAMATLGAFLYNLAAALLGGIEVTLAEDLD